MQREGKRERKIRVAGRQIQSRGRVSGMEGSLTGGLEPGGCSAQELKIYPCVPASAIFPGDTLQYLANTVLLGDKKCCMADHQLSAGARVCRSHERSPLVQAEWAVMTAPLLFSVRLPSVSSNPSGVKPSQSPKSGVADKCIGCRYTYLRNRVWERHSEPGCIGTPSE